MLEIIAVIFCLLTLCSVCLACYALHRSIEAQIEVKAMKASTHQVQFVPIDPTAGDSEKEIETALNKGEVDDWQRAQEFAIQPLS